MFLEEALYVYALLTKREVKMAGYWPSIEYAKKNEANINPSWVTEQVWLIKNLLCGQKNNNYCSRDPTWEILILSGHDGSILPAWVVNQNPGFASSCPLRWIQPYNNMGCVTAEDLTYYYSEGKP